MQQKIGILLVNLGTPNSTQVTDVRKYLNEFLTDPRVISLPLIQRQLLVRLIITPFRSPKTAKLYKEIWTERGSPLKYYGEDLTQALQNELDEYSKTESNCKYIVKLAMRYQNPSIEKGLEELKKENVNKYIILPLFPQYASASTGSVQQKTMEIISTWQTIPSIKFISSFYNNGGFIKAFSEIGSAYNPHQFDHVLFSFHGLPQKQLINANNNNYCLQQNNCCSTICDKNDYCYSAQCHATAHLIAHELKISKSNYTICYQSRLGKDPWVKPYTIDVLKELAQKGIKKLLVFCPAFIADCLETIYEVSIEYNEEFKQLGGEHIQLVPSLNTNKTWIKALKSIILE